MAPPLVPATPAPEPPPPRGEIFPRNPDDDARANFLVPRLALQPPASILLAGATGFASLFPLFLATLPFCAGALIEGQQDEGCETFINTGMAVSATFGAAVGATLVGNLLHGRGRFWHTLLGAAVGTVSSVGLGLTADLETAPYFAIVLASQAIGATVAYAISDSSFSTPVDARRSETGFSVMPVVGTTQAGGVMGSLVGRF